MSDTASNAHGPHPDPPVDASLDVVEDEAGGAGHGPNPDPGADADVQEQDEIADTGSELSFPTSDPPATWAGPDQA